MKTAKENFSEKSLSQKRHPVRQKLLSVLLCACLLLASLPMEGYGSEVQAEEPQKKVLSFSELPEEVKYQTVEPGTSLEELNLPETLEAVCVSAGQDSNVNPETPDVKGTAPEGRSLPEEMQEVSQHTEETEAPEETQEFSGDGNSEVELPAEHETEESEPPAENGPEEQPESPIPDTEPGTGEVPEGNPETNPDTNSEETVVIEHVTWTGIPAYDSETEGVYVFAPVLPEGYVLAEGAELPEIRVEVKSEESPKGDGAEPETFSEGKKEESGTEEALTEEYVSGAEEREYGVRAVSETREISDGETWDNPVTLSNEELVINEGVTLTINNKVTIDGTVIIQGGGTIARGDADAWIEITEAGSLVLQGIVVDGREHISFHYSMLTVSGGKLTVENNCKIQKCIYQYSYPLGTVFPLEDRKGGAVSVLANATAEFNDCVIENCSAKYGSAVYVKESENVIFQNATITGCYGEKGTCSKGTVRVDGNDSTIIFRDSIIKDCKGEAFLAYKVKAELHGVRVENCSGTVGASGASIDCSDSILTLDEGCMIKNNRNGHNVAIRGTTAIIQDSVIVGVGAVGSQGFVIDDGSNVIFKGNTIKDCGRAMYIVGSSTTVEIQDGTIEDCGGATVGAITCSNNATLKIYEGTYRNNRKGKEGSWDYQMGGGFLENSSATVYIYGGTFTGNTASGKTFRGGAIYHSGKKEAKTYLYGGVFMGNSCNAEGFEGSGGAMVASGNYKYPGDRESCFEMSGSVRFCGDGTDSGVDGIYLDSENPPRQKIVIGGALDYPMTVYLKAVEHYVIAQGTDAYTLTEEERKKISVVDVGGSGKNWEVKLDEENNLIYLTEPGTVYEPLSVDFYSGGPELQGPQHMELKYEESNTVTTPYLKEFPGWTALGWNESDEKYERSIWQNNKCVLTAPGMKYYGIYQKDVTLSYELNGGKVSRKVIYESTCYANVHEEITYKEAEFYLLGGVTKTGYNFIGWKMRGEPGTFYKPEEKIKITEDTILDAVYEEKGKKTFRASFYSGSACQPESVAKTVAETAISAEITSPSLQDMEDWEAVGWNDSAEAYKSDIVAGEPCILTEDITNYYGIYRKEATLTYDSSDKEITASATMPEAKEASCYANVHKDEITYKEADFTLPSGPEVSGYIFQGWSEQEDGSGTLHEAGSSFSIQENTTLYAVYEEKGKRTFTADFYSGNPLRIKSESDIRDEDATEGTVTVPSPETITGWTSLGWSKSKEAYTVDSDIQPGRTLTLTADKTEYYGIYEKKITLTYNANGGDSTPPSETGKRYANVHDTIGYQDPEFAIASAIRWGEDTFVGWNTKADGTGTSYEPGSTRKLEEDTLLYAVWRDSAAPEPSDPTGPTGPELSGPDAPAPETAPYRVEYYCQNLTGEEYTRMDSDTELLTGTVGMEAEASRKTYTGFTLNLSHPLGKSKGTVERDGSLVLKLYYDRLIYEVDFSLNGGQGKAPDTQHIRYGGLLEQVSDPLRRGYNFKGWYMDDKGLDGGIWDFESPVEHNTGTLKTTLYAKWADELAPAMGKASFSRGSRDFLDWLIQKESMVVTVPVTEEGSGLEKAEYLLVAEDGTEQEGQAAFTELHTMTDTMAACGSSAAVIRSIRGEAESGSYEARIAIEEEFRGKVYLACTDYAGNVSAQKTLTAEGGGVIVEDNAPEIRFDGTKETTGGKPLEVKVEVRDSEEDRVTSGISGVRYQVDRKKSVSLPEEDFTGDFAEVCEFTVKIKGEGKHTLRVEAEDHAGNESAAEVTLNISGSREVPEEVPADQNPGNPGGPGRTGRPLGGEPKTGDSTQIQICATLAMIAGFGYLLLYFEGENGITEQEKEEMIHRIVTWAKQGGRIRRLLGLAGIFLFLAYYHSIGKSVDVEWKEVYGKN